MPTRPARICGQAGCSELVYDGSGRCEKHRRQTRREQDERRGSAHERGYTARWSKASKRYLRQHPLCEPCLTKGIIEVAEVVDHKIPHKGDPILFWDENNWQSMSKRCHDIKTATEDGGFGK